MQSTLINAKFPQLHVAVIMDGNGRWATCRGLPRIAGHRAGADAVRRTVEAAHKQRISTLTLFAFSSDNWRRSPAEVAALMKLLRVYLRGEVARCVENKIRVNVIGRRDRLPLATRHEIERVEAATDGGDALHLRIAVDYSARDAILRAARLTVEETEISREAFSRRLGESSGCPEESSPDVDLLIRTGGEKRLSDFLLWESAYAELYFTDCMWPDFDERDLAAALEEFYRRERRFGDVPARVAV